MSVISFSDHKARALVKKLVAAQQDIDAAARVLLQGRRHTGEPLEKMLDRMDQVIRDLGRIEANIVDHELRHAIGVMRAAHQRWAKAKLGSDEERAAARVYLDTVDGLAKVAEKRT